MPFITEATLEDCHAMAPKLRPADREEILAALGCGAVEGLTASFEASTQRFAIVHDGEPIAIFGGVALEDGSGSPWMLGTDGIERHWVWFLRNSPAIVQLVQQHYPVLANHVDVRNTVHTRWLKWCGFSFGAVTALGPEGRPFQHFWRHRQCA